MSRSGYSDDFDYDVDYSNATDLYRQCVEHAIRGRRGQRFLRELRDALDAMAVKELGANAMIQECDDGACRPCALAVLADRRGFGERMRQLDEIAADDCEFDWDEKLAFDWDEKLAGEMSRRLDIAKCLVRETMWQNDEGVCAGDSREWREHRWRGMRAWCERHIEQAP